MKTLYTIFISLCLAFLGIFIMSNIGTEIYIKNVNLDIQSINKLSTISPLVKEINKNVNTTFYSSTLMKETDTSDLKEYIADYKDSRNFARQFLDIMGIAYNMPTIFLLAVPMAMFNFINELIMLYLIMAWGSIALTIYVALRGGQTI